MRFQVIYQSETSSSLDELVAEMQTRTGNAENGLSEAALLLASRLTPLINVDLLIQDEHKRTLLTWRQDQFYDPGWYVPGGTIRYKERMEDRIRRVALEAFGVEVEFHPAPILVSQNVATEQGDRGHLISLLYRCRLKGEPDDNRRFDPVSPLPGKWYWHEECPKDLIAAQAPYAAYMGKRKSSLVESLTSHIPPRQLGRYLLVGIWNTLFAYGSYALLTALLARYIPASYLLASLLSSVLNITVSFLGYKWFVFKTKGNYLKEWTRCLLVYSTSIIFGLAALPPIVWAVSYLSNNPASAPYVAGAILLGINLIISFLGHKKFSFRQGDG